MVYMYNCFYQGKSHVVYQVIKLLCEKYKSYRTVGINQDSR